MEGYKCGGGYSGKIIWLCEGVWVMPICPLIIMSNYGGCEM